MTENEPAAAYCPDGEHHWTAHMRGGALIYIPQCTLCGMFDFDAIDKQVADYANMKLANSWQAKLVRDLDRCPHGRHEGDTCSGWTGPGPFDGGCYGGVSAGNPKIPTGQVFAWGLSAQTNWTMPVRDRRSEPEAWVTG